jgi:hypothetical protein
MSTVINGIFQGDIIIRSAVIQALQELRQNPSLIDDVLAGLPKDSLTSGRYGDKTIQQCKDWFLKTDVPVRLGLVLGQLKSPIIAIEMNQNAEEMSTLGDVNYETSEAQPTSFAATRPHYVVESVTGTTVVVTAAIAANTPQTGVLSINAVEYSFTAWSGSTFTVASVVANPGDSVYLVDILTVTPVPVDAFVPTSGSFKVGSTTYAYTGLDRTNGFFSGITPHLAIASGTITFPWRRALESVQSRESYNINVMVEGEPEYLLFLYSLVLFGILRRKEDLLDARGFMRMTWQVGVAGMLDPSLRENFFTRSIQLTGFVMHGWPKYDPNNSLGLISEVPFGGEFAPPVHNADGDATSTPQTPTEPPPPGHDPFQEANWADRDVLSGRPGP